MQEEIRDAHACLRKLFPGIERVAAAVYDPGADLLKTFAHSTDGGNPLELYEASLRESPSLEQLARSGKDRVLDDLDVLSASPHEHTRRLIERGYRSSYTVPLFEGGRLFGFLFFDSREPGYFRPVLVEHLAIFARFLTLALAQGFAQARLLESALRVATRLTHYRDPETRGHLDRMARCSRLIARSLAPDHGLSDEFVESTLRFAPLHDIGKIAVPDHILLKQGPLTSAEFEVMQTHVLKGVEIVEGILSELDLGAISHLDMLRNVVHFHHEAVDGSGYPQGRRGSEIPIEARIVKVADVFDALTSRRPYKRAWTVEDALSYLTGGAGRQFDPDCVAALVSHADEAAALIASFTDPDDAEQSREGYSLDL
ncbi:MAG: HD domain-containing protein [Vicinamibacteria bacterium]|nr:HD domain-containing protein [Vicinamibacteria bacterium]